MTKVSVIVPIYNNEKELTIPINSMLKQTYKNWELILVNDGSTDGSAAVCDELAENHKNIVTIHQQNQGASAARNTGIMHATGEYLLFLDGDDWLESDAIENAVERIEGDKTDIAIFAMQIDRYDGNTVESTKLLYGEDTVMDKIKISENFSKLYYQDYLCSACTKLFKKEIIDKNGIKFRTDLVMYEDFYFVMDYIDAITQASIINKILFHYRMDKTEIAINKRVSSDLLKNLDTVASRVAEFTKGISAYGSGEVKNIIASLYEMYFYKLFVGNCTPKQKFEGIKKTLSIKLFVECKKASASKKNTIFYKLLHFAVCNRIAVLIYILYSRRYPNKN